MLESKVESMLESKDESGGKSTEESPKTESIVESSDELTPVFKDSLLSVVGTLDKHEQSVKIIVKKIIKADFFIKLNPQKKPCGIIAVSYLIIV